MEARHTELTRPAKQYGILSSPRLDVQCSLLVSVLYTGLIGTGIRVLSMVLATEWIRTAICTASTDLVTVSDENWLPCTFHSFAYCPDKD